VATDFCKPDVFQGILNLFKVNPTRNEVHKLLLDRDNEGKMVWQVSAFCGNVRKFFVENVDLK
jgi:hypothetical protein